MSERTLFKAPAVGRIALFLALAAFVLAAKIQLIGDFGSDLPYWDQWDAEGDFLFRPYIEGRLTAADIFRSHNEHRPVFTRLLALALLEAGGGQWDGRVQMLANALLHTGLALLLLGFAWRLLPPLAAAGFACVAAVFFGTSVSWENTLSGFQSQFYFLLLFSALHLSATLRSRPGSWRWWLAPLFGAAAILSMASGLLSAIAILAVLALHAVRDRRLKTALWWPVASNAFLAGAGWFLKADVPGHASLKAATVGTWFDAWLHQISWPVPSVWAAPLGVLPPALVALAYLRRRIDGPHALALVGASAWVCLQTAAIAYARGGEGFGFSSRYCDALALGVLINLLSLVYLTYSLAPRLRWRGATAVTIFAGLSIGGLMREANHTQSSILQHLPAINHARIAAVRDYVNSKDPAFFTKSSWDQLPYPSAERLASLLDDSVVRATLPASVRSPLSIEPDSTATTGFTAHRGNSPPGPPPSGLKAWIGESTGPSRFISEPFPVDRTRVSLFIARQNPSDSAIALVGPSGDRHTPLGELGDRPQWKRINFNVPTGVYRLEATNAANGWLAITQPMTNSRLSAFALKIFPLRPWLLGIGLASGIVAVAIFRPRSRGAPIEATVAVVVAIAACGTMVPGWFPSETTRVAALPPLNFAPDPIGENGWQRSPSPAGPTPEEFRDLHIQSSYIGGDGFVGEYVTPWFTPKRGFNLLISGYPRMSPNRLVVEARNSTGETTPVEFDGENPRERWTQWAVDLPSETQVARIRATDATTSIGGWLGFTEPFSTPALTINLGMTAQLFGAVVLALVLTVGPGLIWRAWRGAPFAGLLWPGPLGLALGGCVCWAFGGFIPPAKIACVWVLGSLAAIVWFSCRARIWTGWTATETRIYALLPLCVLGATAKAAFSGGPEGELYSGRISRTLEIGDRPDSRISFHTVQLVAHHLSPNEPAGEKYFLPWHFSSRGPLSGFAATPLVLAMGGRPPLEFPEQSWAPFDPQGFATYRVMMTTLAVFSLLGVVSLLDLLGNGRLAGMGAALLVLSPFFWHELYFTWPKWIAASWVVAGFAALWKRRPLSASVWLGGAYLWHPLALMSAPFFCAWLLFRPGNPVPRRMAQTAIFAGGVFAIVACWLLLNRGHPSQGGFLQYFRAADGIYDVDAGTWWLSRWNNFANTFLPFYVLIANSGHAAFNAIDGRSSPLVQFCFQYWTAAPFAAGLFAWIALLPAFFRAVKRQLRVAAVTLLGPVMLFILYWGYATTGLMREGSHVHFLAACIFLAWAAGDAIPQWFFGPVFTAVRGVELFAMMFFPALAAKNWGGIWLQNDLFWLLVAGACIATIARIVVQEHRTGAQASVPVGGSIRSAV